MEKNPSLFAIILFLTTLFSLGAQNSLPQEKTLIMGGDSGWELLTNPQRAGSELDPLGRSVLTLVSGEYQNDSSTDMLFSFNDNPVMDKSKHYILNQPWTSVSKNLSRMGQGSAIFHNTGDVLRLEAQSGSLFYPGTPWEDFTLEFWLYPATVQEGETLFLWQGSRSFERQFFHQEVRIGISGRRLQFGFDNFFVPPGLGPFRAELKGKTPLLPRQWRHHSIRFDSRTGLLEYTVDGIPEDSRHMTPTGRENAQVFLPYVGTASQRVLQIGPRYSGSLDELRIHRSWVEDKGLYNYLPQPVTLESQILDLEVAGSIPTSLELKHRLDPLTSVALWYRMAEDKSYQWQQGGPTLVFLDTPWIPLQPNASLLQGPRGRFAQVKIQLLPDGAGQGTPRISEIRLNYLRNQPPSTPKALLALATDGQVELSWTPVLQTNLKGYRIHWGEAPGQYENYVDVPPGSTYVIPNLTNLKLYFFTISAYEELPGGTRNYSPFAREVSARPRREGL